MDALVHGDFGLGAGRRRVLVRGGGVGDGHTLVQIAGIGQTYTVSPTFLIDGTFGWTRFGQNVEPPDLGTNFGLDVLGIPGTNGPDPRESGMPPLYISGYSALGNTEGWNPLFRNDQSYTFNTNASWMKGTHDIRFGFDFVHHLMNHWQPELGEGPRGAFYFDPGVTALNPDALDATVGFQGGTPSFENDWNGLAGFLLGTPDVSGKSSQFIKMNSFENQYALYIRDRWRATPKLTLDLGLRWELYPEPDGARGGLGIESYDPTTNEALIGGRGGIPQDNGVGYSKKLFAPRLGFAYQVTDSTVIRSGYGITYHSHPWGAQALRGWYPLTVVAVFSGVNGYQPVTTDPAYVAAGVPNAPLGPTVGFHRSAAPTSARAGFRCPRWPRRATPWRTRCCTAATSSRGTSSSSASCRPRWSRRLDTSGRRRSGASRSSTSTPRRFPAPATKGGRSSRSSDARRRPGSGTAARTATTTRCRRPSIGASADGLLLKGAYTYSKAIDEATYSDWTEFSWNAPSVFDRNRAWRTHNIPHNFQLGFVYELPFGGGKKWATSGYQQRDPGRLAAERRLRRLLGAAVHADRLRPVAEHAGQRADAGPGQGQRRDTRQGRRRRHVLRHDRICARHGGPVRQRGPEHHARARRGEPGLEPVPHVQAHAAGQAAVPGGGVQRDQHAALRQPERQRQQLELREDPRDADRGCTGPVPGVPLRLASDVSAALAGMGLRCRGDRLRFTIANGKITEIEVIGNPARLGKFDVSIVD